MEDKNHKDLALEYLDSLSELTICHLKLLQNYNFHPEVKLIDIEVFSDGLSDGLPVRIFLIDEFNSEVFHEDKEYFPDSSIGLLEYVQISNFASDFEQDDETDLTTAAIIEWLIECWQKAGGQSFKLPAYIGQHDDIMSFNLKTLEWKDEKDDKFQHFTD